MTPDISSHIQTAVRRALAEDLRDGDVTTRALFARPVPARASIVAKQPITVAGIAVARAVFAAVDRSLKVRKAVADGAMVKRGSTILLVEGDGRSLLMAERVALNFLQRLSGIATLTAAFCKAVRGYRVKVLDTRKTTPGLRVLEKWAVTLGGGHNHRQSLGDGVLIKDNHLALAGGQVTAVCRTARERAPHGLMIEVEAQSLEHVSAALEGKADIILLDNMDVATIRRAMALIKD
ncbi:MAG TPA: carboxylating nicotinate-nucleotide diphosphorylase, partial [Nitrospirales bacterium]|nr:carboxylating nicotinate-nucleotide diphosphorylase [Nitrospirales bacterium]